MPRGPSLPIRLSPSKLASHAMLYACRCYHEDECRHRTTTPLGSSKSYVNGSLSFGNFMGGILSPNASVNWASTWNAVYVGYCDGTSFSSNLAEPLVAAGKPPLWYRGRANMVAVIKDLLANRGLGAATDVLMDGGSAGGLTALIHADFFKGFLSPSTYFGAIGDAGWFRPDINLDHSGYTQSIADMWSVGNCSFNAACETAYKHLGPAYRWKCGLAPNVFPLLTSKMFVMEGAYDSFQVGNFLGFPCATYGKTLAGCTDAQNVSLEEYGAAMRTSIRAALASTAHHRANAGAFVSSCIIHVQSMDNENHGWDSEHNRYYDGSSWGKDAWNMLDSDDSVPGTIGKTPSDVVRAWFIDGKEKAVPASERVFIQEGPFGSNPNCQSFT